VRLIGNIFGKETQRRFDDSAARFGGLYARLFLVRLWVRHTIRLDRFSE